MKNIVSLLQSIGFSQYEAQAYLALLQHSNVTGYELAKNSGIPASKIYQILTKLIDRELVLVIDSEPKKYLPISPDEILGRMKVDYLNTVDQLSTKLNKVYTEETLASNYIWHISERDQIMRKIRQFIADAKDHIYLSVWDEEIDEIRDSLQEADNKKVAITIVHFGQKLLGFGTEYPHGREHHIRLARGGRRITLIIDDKIVVVGHFSEDGQCNAAWTANSGLVLLARDYINHDVYTIRIQERFGEEAIDLYKQV
jgi:sugar-specific transcriptional regulator TrmB